MQKITVTELKHIAKLAKMKLSEDEIEKFTNQMCNILDFFEQLAGVKTDKVAETSQVTGLENVTRLDEIKLCKYEDQLLNCTPHDIENYSIRIPKIM